MKTGWLVLSLVGGQSMGTRAGQELASCNWEGCAKLDKLHGKGHEQGVAICGYAGGMAGDRQASHLQCNGARCRRGARAGKDKSGAASAIQNPQV